MMINTEQRELIQQNAGLSIAIGGLIALMGLVILCSPLLVGLVTGLTIGLAVGIILALNGLGQFAMAARVHRGILPWIGAALSLMAGLYLLTNPSAAIEVLVVVIGVYLLLSGLAESALALQLRPIDGWLWTLISGLLSVVLGVLLLAEYPFSGEEAIGILLGLRLLLGGIAAMMLGVSARSAGA